LRNSTIEVYILVNFWSKNAFVILIFLLSNFDNGVA